MKTYYVYILSSCKNGTLYIGVTSDLARRIFEHKQGLIPGFTSIYNVKNLVHVEYCTTMSIAIAREKQLKHWKRQWKIDLIAKNNPSWSDLSLSFQ